MQQCDLGSTSLGGAALNAIVPFAKQAGFAKNAGAVNGIKASKLPRPGSLVPLGKDGKFPQSVGQAGPPGPAARKRERGARVQRAPPAPPAPPAPRERRARRTSSSASGRA